MGQSVTNEVDVGLAVNKKERFRDQLQEEKKCLCSDTVE